MSKETNPWEERAYSHSQHLCQEYGNYYEKGYLTAIEDFKEALKKEIQGLADKSDNGRHILDVDVLELIETVKPKE